MPKVRGLLAVWMVAMLASGCVFVQPTEGGKKVRVLTAGEVERCRSLGTLTSQVADSVAAVPRSREAVADDVLLNAKNAAAAQEADTIVPASEMKNGRQTFNIYRCLLP
ncbi:MAG TPA: DUF4156 domain-containing protein [Burkholderiales bacterium]|nr:DUF4156 domain-containing protein [Burkholderiales bacterium]